MLSSIPTDTIDIKTYIYDVDVNHPAICDYDLIYEWAEMDTIITLHLRVNGRVILLSSVMQILSRVIQHAWASKFKCYNSKVCVLLNQTAMKMNTKYAI